jgi:hypothetical protein
VDLAPFRARGLPGEYDRFIAEIPVEGIDREQAQALIRFAPETEALLYGPDYTPRRIEYHIGTRPIIEKIADCFTIRSADDWFEQAMNWVAAQVVHPHLVGDASKAGGQSEEAIIESEVGWCNEQARVFLALCEVSGFPARLCFLFHENGRCSHVATEVYREERWAFYDPTFGVCVRLPDGRLAETRDLSEPFRETAHAAYRSALERYYTDSIIELPDDDSWSPGNRPAWDRGGDLLHMFGISNYLIDGVSPLTTTR